MDPFVDLIRLLRPRATLWTRIDAGGRWGVSFRQREDTLFCWVQSGECLLLRPNSAPVLLSQDDFALVRTTTPFTLTSDPASDVEDSDAVFAAVGKKDITLGGGSSSPVILRGGRFVFDTANEDLLMGLLPQVVHVASSDTRSRHLRALLAINEEETRVAGTGSEFVIERIMELILVEILRSRALRLDPMETGMIAGLADPLVRVALTAMHGEVARAWTVASLARHCGISRSGFGHRFRLVMGIGPIEYLQRWRMAVAKDELRRGTRGVGEIGLAVGFQSASAFSTAFTRAVGCSPRSFAENRK
jgi:AraC-like DNA-binding protein